MKIDFNCSNSSFCSLEVIDMATLQVRSMDDRLYEALGKRAAMENRSISQQVVFILKTYLATPASRHPEATERFLEICGTWDDPRDAETIAAGIRAARRTGRRSEATL
jgi:plasmid stability protein